MNHSVNFTGTSWGVCTLLLTYTTRVCWHSSFTLSRHVGLRLHPGLVFVQIKICLSLRGFKTRSNTKEDSVIGRQPNSQPHGYYEVHCVKSKKDPIEYKAWHNQHNTLYIYHLETIVASFIQTKQNTGEASNHTTIVRVPEKAIAQSHKENARYELTVMNTYILAYFINVLMIIPY